MYFAHAFGQRYELPLPLQFFIFGGAAVVVASFLLVLRRPVDASQTNPSVPDPAPVPPTPAVLGVLGVLGLAGLISAGLFGSQTVAENIVPTTFWLVIWIAIPLTCGVIGDWTRSINPFALLARCADSASLRRVLLGDPTPVRWPRCLGWWPAVVTFFVVACGELIYNQTATLPRVTAYALIALAAITLLAGFFFGAEAWLQRGEMFSVLFATWGRLRLWRLITGGRRGRSTDLVAPFEPVPSRIAFVLMLLVSVSFDGLLATPTWQQLRLRALANDTSSTTVEGLTTAAFVVLALATFAVFGLFALGVARLGGHQRGIRTALAGLLPSLLPIAFGYLLAHNLQYLLVNGQLLIPLLGDPAGQGWHLLPAPFNDDYEIHINLLPAAFYWYAAAAVIIAVHVAAVVIAHRHLGRSGVTLDQARRSEWPWLVAMVAYTMVSIWLLAQPLVKEKPAQPQANVISTVHSRR